MVKVIGVGDCMVDKNLTNGMMYPGGQALNIAVNTKLCGAPVLRLSVRLAMIISRIT